MSGLFAAAHRNGRFETRAATRDPAWVKWTLVGLGVSYFALFLLLPLISVFAEALRKGWEVYFAAIVEPDAIASIKLTLLAAAIAVPFAMKSRASLSPMPCATARIAGATQAHRWSGGRCIPTRRSG